MDIAPLRKDLEGYLLAHGLTKKWDKVRRFFEHNPRHPSLSVELLQPKWRGIYSLRIDRRYRALFFIRANTAEVFQITNHYKK
jgi:Txe/YoeB family toxin of Txe-Axe toxin-antitoxin module